MKTIGVIIGRFQVPELHEGHKELIRTVMANSHWTCLLLGTSPIFSRQNPLSFCQRKHMINEEFKDISIFPLTDNTDDKIWSANLDHLLESLYPGKNIELYHGRDSFKDHYTGKFKVVDVGVTIETSGTKIREETVSDYNLSSRKAFVDAARLLYPTSYQAVDVVCYNDKKEFLIGHKAITRQWCFPGGFVDPKDDSLETCALRDLQEETGLSETCSPQYITSFQTHDWRFKNTEHALMTAVYATQYISGTPQDSDELKDLRFVSYDEAKKLLTGNSLKMLEETWNKISSY